MKYIVIAQHILKINSAISRVFRHLVRIKTIKNSLGPQNSHYNYFFGKIFLMGQNEIKIYNPLPLALNKLSEFLAKSCF